VVYKAVGRPDILNGLSFVKLALLAPTLWWCAVNYGIEGVAWGQLAVSVLSIFIDMWTVARFVQISVLSNLRVIWPPLASSAIMLVAVNAVFMLDASQSSIPVLITAMAVGVLVYAAMIWLLDRRAVRALIDLAQSLIRRNRPAAATEL